MYPQNYLNYDDIELIELYRAGNEIAGTVLIGRYVNMINHRCWNININGFDTDDIKQEAYMGLFNAIRTFNIQRGVSFSAYANICIKNSIKNVLASSFTNKAVLNSSAISLDDIDEDLKPIDDNANPEAFLIEKEALDSINNKIDTALTAMEKRTLLLYLGGLNYTQISNIINLSTKSVDNALWRARKKLKEVLSQN